MNHKNKGLEIRNPMFYTTTAGFEPTRTVSNGFQVHRLNHSARLPLYEKKVLGDTFLMCYADSGVRTHAS